MNKKTLILITVMTLAMMAPPLMPTVQAKKMELMIWRDTPSIMVLWVEQTSSF